MCTWNPILSENYFVFGFQIGTLLEVVPVESLKEKFICNAMELEYFSTEVVALKNSLLPLCFDPFLDNVNVQIFWSISTMFNKSLPKMYWKSNIKIIFRQTIRSPCLLIHFCDNSRKAPQNRASRVAWLGRLFLFSRTCSCFCFLGHVFVFWDSSISDDVRLYQSVQSKLTF